jgi:hypothetical protein
MGAMPGVLGVTIGVAGAAAGLLLERRRRVARGEAVGARELAGFDARMWHRDSVKRRVLAQAAAVAFAAGLIGLLLYAVATAIWGLPHPPAYALLSLACALLGASCVAVSRRQQLA